MSKSRRYTRVALTVLSLALPAAPVVGQDGAPRTVFERLSPNNRELVVEWLRRDCGATEQLVLEREITQVARQIEPAFWEAYRLGPPAEELQAKRASLARSYKERAAWLSTQGARLFGQDEATRLVRMPLDIYVKRGLDALVASYREAAILGVGLVASQDSISKLQKLAGDPNDVIASAARQALKAAREKRDAQPEQPGPTAPTDPAPSNPTRQP